MGWFKFGDSAPASIPAAVVAATVVPYPQKMKKSRENLSWLVKKHSDVLSTQVYSELRELDRILTDINVFIESHTANADDEHMLDSIMNDYIPSAIQLFIRLPEHAKKTGDEGDSLLLKQCRTMAKDLKVRNDDLHDRATKDLRTQAAFIQERFNDNG